MITENLKRNTGWYKMRRTKRKKETKMENIFTTNLMYTGRYLSVWRDDGVVFLQMEGTVFSFPDPEFADLTWILCQLGTYLYSDLSRGEKRKIMKELIKNREEILNDEEEVLCDECRKERDRVEKTKNSENKMNDSHSMYA